MLSEFGGTLPWFLAGTSLVILLSLALGVRKDRVGARIKDLAGAGGANPGRANVFGARSGGKHGPLVVEETEIDRWTSRRIRQEEKKQTLQQRMTQAGLYRPAAVRGFIVVRVLLLLTPLGLGLLLAEMGLVPRTHGIVFGVLAGLIGTLSPTFWLDHVKRSRQTKIRRALPDALDVMVVCLEGGLSLTGSFSRVARELATAHPMLAVEFQIVERQTQMGRTIGQAVREFAGRFDLEELRSMASVIVQAERIGASVVTALEVYAETLRQKRSQRAEEMAQKAAVKLLFPTLLFIFPGIFLVILGPAAIQIYRHIIQGVFLRM